MGLYSLPADFDPTSGTNADRIRGALEKAGWGDVDTHALDRYGMACDFTGNTVGVQFFNEDLVEWKLLISFLRGHEEGSWEIQTDLPPNELALFVAAFPEDMRPALQEALGLEQPSASELEITRRIGPNHGLGTIAKPMEFEGPPDPHSLLN